MPGPSSEEKRRAEEKKILESPTLEEFLGNMRGRFGDEHNERKYAALPGWQPGGRGLLETWAVDHLRFSDLTNGQKLAGNVWPTDASRIVCLESDAFPSAFQIEAGDEVPRSALLKLWDGSAPMDRLRRGYSLRCFGDVPPAGKFRGRFCGVYTGRLSTDDELRWLLVGMFDTPANREGRRPHAP